MVVTLHEPFAVVALDEGRDLALGMSEIREAMQPQALLLQGAHEALDDAVALRLADERRRVLNAQPPQLGAEGMGGVLRPPVGADRQAARHVLADAAQRVADALIERLERRPAIAALGRLPADDLVRAVIDCAEEPAPAIALGPEARRVRAPELVRAIGRDAAGVRPIGMHMSRAPPGP